MHSLQGLNKKRTASGGTSLDEKGSRLGKEKGIAMYGGGRYQANNKNQT